MSKDNSTPVDPSSPRLGLRGLLLSVAIFCGLLILLAGSDIRESGEKMDDGPLRTVVLAVGEPAGWLADALPVADANDRLQSWLSPDDDLSGDGGAVATGATGGLGPEAFDPAELGEKPAPPRKLATVLVTGDSLSQPLDVVMARRLEDDGLAKTIRDPHIGTGISKTALLDWGKLSVEQVGEHNPEAVVLFLGANEGFPFEDVKGEVECCTAAWAAAYANRARKLLDAYRQAGAARVYWLTVPIPRDPDRAKIAKTVNVAIRAAAAPYRAQVRVVPVDEIFTPGGRFRDSMEIDGREQIVRDPDGIHLNDEGAELLADQVLPAIQKDFAAATA